MSPLPVRMTPKKEVVLNSVAEFLGNWALHTSYLSRAPHIYSCKFFLASVNFFSDLTQKFGNLLCIYIYIYIYYTGTSPKRRRRRLGPTRRERDRQRAARHQAAQAGAPPASTPPAAPPAAPSTPEHLRDSGRSILDTLSVSPANSKREEMEDEDDSIHDSKPEYPPW